MSLLDTNVLSELWRANGDPLVKRRVRSQMEAARISVITMGEIDRGIRLLPKSDGRRPRLERYYNEIRNDYGDRILPVTLRVAEWWADLTVTARRGGRVLQTSDGLIAATACVFEMTLWTRNLKDFEGLGVDLFNPWEERWISR